MRNLLRRGTPEDVRSADRRPVDSRTLAQAAAIVDAVEREGWSALERLAYRFGDVEAGRPLLYRPADLQRALEGLAPATRDLLQRTARRIEAFARAQRNALSDVSIPVPGGRAGHRVVPVRRAGCYAPGGRHPLPSSVLMTAVTARVAGVAGVWVASPRPAPETLAAAALAGADGLLAAGGAHATAALALGAGPVPACDVLVGPGNRWVTAAKQLLGGRVRTDALAGPSELVILADASADAALAAADLLAQAEHDPDAVPILVTTDPSLPPRVEAALEEQLARLTTAATALAALEANGLAVVCADLDEAVAVCEELAPEHLQLLVERPRDVAPRLTRYGALFLGPASAEVLGDYGAGPNHTLPTGGAARHSGGLSVLDFLAVRTWLELEHPAELAADAEALAGIEGLEAHARAAARRKVG